MLLKRLGTEGQSQDSLVILEVAEALIIHCTSVAGAYEDGVAVDAHW